jgi:replicative DNA helicase
LGGAPIFVDDDHVSSVAEVRSKALELRSRVGRLGLVVIDHVQLLRGGPRDEPTIGGTAAATSSRALKALAVELSAPVVALSRRSRPVGMFDQTEPVLASLAVPGPFDVGADIVMVLGRAELGLRKRQRSTGDGVVAERGNVSESVFGLDELIGSFDVWTDLRAGAAK